ncbi:MAG: sugar ABC transporter permease [Anaerolineales bacterium]|jgi:ABC-type sugar transport system permease subunit
MTISRSQALLLFVPLLLILLPFLIWPAAFGFFASFTNYAPVQPNFHFLGLGNYREVLGDPQFQTACRNVAVFALIAVPTELALGLGIAYLLRQPFRGRGWIRVALLTPWLVSPIATGVMWHFLFNDKWGLFGFWFVWLRLPIPPSPLGLSGLALLTAIAIDVWRKAPLASFLLLPGLVSIPNDQWEQSTLDGASLLLRIRHVALPWMRPLLLTVGLLLLGDTLGTFDTVLILTGGGPGSATMTPGLYSFQQAFQINNWPVGATSAWLIMAMVLLMGALYLSLVRPERER